MPTITEIQNNLLTFSAAGKSLDFKNTLNGILLEQKAQIATNIYATTFSNLSKLTATTTLMSAAATMAKDLMLALGAYVPVATLGTAVSAFATAKNYTALTNVATGMSATQKSAIPSADVDNALRTIAGNDNPLSTSDNYTIANAVQGLMTNLGARATGAAIGSSILLFGQALNYNALKYATDNLSATQKSGVSALQVDNVLSVLVRQAVSTTVNNAMIDIYGKLGTNASGAGMTDALVSLATSKNITVFNTFSGGLTAAQKTAFDLTKVDGILASVAAADNLASTSDNATIATAITNIMTAFGANVGAAVLGNALTTMIAASNLVAGIALVGNLTTAQKAAVTAAHANSLVQMLAATENSSTANDALITTQITTLMRNVGDKAAAGTLSDAAVIFASNGNFTATNALLTKLTTAQKSAFPAADADALLTSIATKDSSVTTDDALIKSVLTTVINTVGTLATGAAISLAAYEFANVKDYAALDVLFSRLTATQKAALDATNISNAALEIARADSSLTTDDRTILNALRTVLDAGAAKITGATISSMMYEFAYVKNLAALDAVTDNLTTAQKSALNAASVGDALIAVAGIDGGGLNAAEVARDLMHKVGSVIANLDLTYATQYFAYDQNVYGINAVVGELSGTKYNSVVSASIKSQMDSLNITTGKQTDDTITGGTGNNKIFGLGGNDTIKGAAGNDLIFGDAGTDTLQGNDGNDYLYGGTGNDSLSGGAGTDRLAGGQGKDSLSGGVGADTFIFDAIDVGTGVDNITDFKAADGDKIDISDVLELHNSGDAINAFVKLAVSGGVGTLSVDVNGAEGGANFVALATIVGVASTATVDSLINGGNLVI